MDDETLLDQLSREAFERVDQLGNDPMLLDEPWKTIVLIHSAQGVIDNGGFAYFFENDWPHFTPYEEFARAYDRIGKSESGTALRDAVSAMGLESPEHSLEARRHYIATNQIDARGRIKGWDEAAVVGDSTVWAALAAWIRCLRV